MVGDTNAKTKPRAYIGITVVRGEDRLEIENLDSLSGWYAIIKWNRRHRYWRLVARNMLDLPKYLWRHLWQRTS